MANGLLVARVFRDRFHHSIEVKTAGLLARRELLEALQSLRMNARSDDAPIVLIGGGGRFCTNPASIMATHHATFIIQGRDRLINPGPEREVAGVIFAIWSIAYRSSFSMRFAVPPSSQDELY
jgi:hypothetical protein